MLTLVSNCIDRLNVYNSAAHFGECAGSEAGAAWKDILNLLYELLGEMLVVTAHTQIHTQTYTQTHCQLQLILKLKVQIHICTLTHRMRQMALTEPDSARGFFLFKSAFFLPTVSRWLITAVFST